jgi:3-methyladenine DNA glycosylase AlkD
MTGDCEGWAWLDWLATKIIGPVALAHGDPAWRDIRGWTDDPWLWTRRASILAHVPAARKGALEEAYAWPTFEERLFEKEFFIRKAVGWALRECAKHYAPEVCDFLVRVGGRASGLTRREGARRLPPELRRRVEEAG